MGLPIQAAPTYVCNLSDGREVKYRPFLVKEQKYLLIAKESEDGKEIAEALTQLIESVTFGKIDANKLSLFDLEYLFLQIRTKSVGETTKVKFLCGEEDCTGSGSAEINLNEVKLTENPLDSKLMLTDNLGLVLKYPTVGELSIEDTDDRLIATVMYGIETIFDENEVYECKDVQSSDLKEFVESLTLEQLEKVNEYFIQTPSLKENIEYTCELCGTKQEKVLQGLNSFF
jgi:hypothetical protein